jgi:serine/tyrosine/threonine adenylyltransferase
MHPKPQAASYHPDPQILTITSWLADPVVSANFPQTTLRFRNDRHAATIGLEHLTDAAWAEHFGRFTPLPNNLPKLLALRYHGHQFRHYNPDLGDGRGFLFAQIRDEQGRLLDLGTKGSGQTPHSRAGDGRLTLKGAMREILATEMLEAMGANTSKTFSVIETGESLDRGDEPSPTRSAVLVRLSHSHIRIGTFQRLAALEQHDNLAQLVDYCLQQFPAPPPPDTAPDRDNPAIIFFTSVITRMADMAAAYVASGFVHGVLNTDNMNITGESFDYGPWRWLPAWDAQFTAAYFDHQGLYCFGRQAEAIRWNCAQLAIALRPLAESAPLIAALENFEPQFQTHLIRCTLWRLGVIPRGTKHDTALLTAAGNHMQSAQISPDQFFFAHRAGRNPPTTPFGDLLKAYTPAADLAHPIWTESAPPSNIIDTVEAIWSAIDRDDDWTPLHRHIAQIRDLGAALGPAPIPAGHAPAN